MPTISDLLLNKNIKAVYQLITSDYNRLEEMMDIYFSADYRNLQPISHVMDLIIKNDREDILSPYYKRLIDGLREDRHDGYIRNTYRYFQDALVPEDYDGLLYDMAFQDFMNPKKAIAIRAFAMQTCVNIARPYPELWPELIDALTLCTEDAAPGIKSRSRNMIKELEKLQ